jgi:phosphoglycolate phosphatase-like HAD superfamily hydrolase
MSALLLELRPDLTEDDVNRYSLAKETLFRELALKEIQPVDGLLRLLDTLGELQVPTAIVTNAPR